MNGQFYVNLITLAIKKMNIVLQKEMCRAAKMKGELD